MTTFYWHDYETWGTNPAIDRPSQFAGVRTDEDLNIISEPLVIYCQPPPDILPQPEACLVTGITPQHALAEGLKESEFIQRIRTEFMQPGTCGVGYNSLRFDDEVTRYTLYRNFYDPYEREWRNGNSRWDIIDMLRLVHALRPEGIVWPEVDGRVSFRLELLTAANNISHGAAHDAYSDVVATIELAKLIKQKKPQLYDYVIRHRTKQACTALIDVANKKPLLHISSKFPASRGCAGLVLPLAQHPINKNAVIAYDLSIDPSPLEILDINVLRERVFTRAEDLPDGVERLPIKLIHLNKCPILLPTKMLSDDISERLTIDKKQCEEHWRILCDMEVEYKVRQLYEDQLFSPKGDAEQQLYAGFLNNEDKALMQAVQDADIHGLAGTNFLFNDARLNDMLVYYKARNFPDVLSDEERYVWEEKIGQQLYEGVDGMLTLEQFDERIRMLEIEKTDAHSKKILQALRDYSSLIM